MKEKKIRSQSLENKKGKLSVETEGSVGENMWHDNMSKKTHKTSNVFTPSSPQAKSFKKEKKSKKISENFGDGEIETGKKAKKSKKLQADQMSAGLEVGEQASKKRKDDEEAGVKKKKFKILPTPKGDSVETVKTKELVTEEQQQSKEQKGKAKLAKRVKQKGIKDPELIEAVRSRIDERRELSVFIKGSAVETMEVPKLMKLVPGIINARKKFQKAKFAILQFKSRKLAQKGHKLLQEIKIEGQELFVDFVSSKNKNNAPKEGEESKTDIKADPQKLYIGGLPLGTTKDDLAPLFQKASDILIPNRKNATYAFVKFKSDEDAQEAFMRSKKLKIKEQTVNVQFGILKSRKKKSPVQRKKENERKKHKTQKSLNGTVVNKLEGKTESLNAEKVKNGKRNNKNVNTQNSGDIVNIKIKKKKKQTLDSSPSKKKKKLADDFQQKK